MSEGPGWRLEKQAGGKGCRGYHSPMLQMRPASLVSQYNRWGDPTQTHLDT